MYTCWNTCALNFPANLFKSRVPSVLFFKSRPAASWKYKVFSAAVSTALARSVCDFRRQAPRCFSGPAQPDHLSPFAETWCESGRGCLSESAERKRTEASRKLWSAEVDGRHTPLNRCGCIVTNGLHACSAAGAGQPRTHAQKMRPPAKSAVFSGLASL